MAMSLGKEAGALAREKSRKLFEKAGAKEESDIEAAGIDKPPGPVKTRSVAPKMIDPKLLEPATKGPEAGKPVRVVQEVPGFRPAEGDVAFGEDLPESLDLPGEGGTADEGLKLAGAMGSRLGGKDADRITLQSEIDPSEDPDAYAAKGERMRKFQADEAAAGRKVFDRDDPLDTAIFEDESMDSGRKGDPASKPLTEWEGRGGWKYKMSDEGIIATKKDGSKFIVKPGDKGKAGRYKGQDLFQRIYGEGMAIRAGAIDPKTGAMSDKDYEAAMKEYMHEGTYKPLSWAGGAKGGGRAKVGGKAPVEKPPVVGDKGVSSMTTGQLREAASYRDPTADPEMVQLSKDAKKELANRSKAMGIDLSKGKGVKDLTDNELVSFAGGTAARAYGFAGEAWLPDAKSAAIKELERRGMNPQGRYTYGGGTEKPEGDVETAGGSLDIKADSPEDLTGGSLNIEEDSPKETAAPSGAALAASTEVKDFSPKVTEDKVAAAKAQEAAREKDSTETLKGLVEQGLSAVDKGGNFDLDIEQLEAIADAGGTVSFGPEIIRKLIAIERKQEENAQALADSGLRLDTPGITRTDLRNAGAQAGIDKYIVQSAIEREFFAGPSANIEKLTAKDLDLLLESNPGEKAISDAVAAEKSRRLRGR